MADTVKIQIVVNGKVAAERDMGEGDTLQYSVSKSDGRLCHLCNVCCLTSHGVRWLALIKATTIDPPARS